MRNFLDRNIKDVLDERPEVQNILDKYKISCASCSLGTCPLKDIIDIHNLTVKDEEDLLNGIAKVLYPGRNVAIPRVERKQESAGVTRPLSPPLRKLADEHCHITKVIAGIPGIIALLNSDPEKGTALAKEGVEFVRRYADEYHHAKEEDILFSRFDPDLDIVKTMLREHEEGRAHIRAVIRLLEEGTIDDAGEHLIAYGKLLTEHIRKEDEVLYPWMDGNLSDRDVGILYAEFGGVDREYAQVSEKWETFAENLGL